MRPLYQYIGSKKEQGAASILLVGFAAMAIAGALAYTSTILQSRYSSVRLGSVGQSILMNLVGRVRLGITAQSSCAKLNSKLSPFRNFSSSAAPYSINLSGATISLPCLLTDDEAKNVSSIKLELIEVSNDPKILSKTMRISINLKLKDHNGKNPPRQANLSHGLTLRVASLDQFNVVLTGSSAPLIQTLGPKLTFAEAIFHANPKSLPIDAIVSAPGPDKVALLDTFYSRSRALSSKSKSFDTTKLRDTFVRGIETDVLNSPVLDQFLPHNSKAWNHGIDYYFVSNKSGYPVPQTASNIGSFDCSAANSYSDARGRIRTIPAAGSLEQASLSCGPDTLIIPVLQSMDPTSAFAINLTNGDNIFCGLIVADQLRINLAKPGKYALFGHFMANNILVSGPSGAELFIYSPTASDQLDVELPNGIATLRTQVKSLASSTAFNFFLPIAANTPFLPRSPDSYMANCGNGYTSYQASYPPLEALPQFNNLRYDSAKPLYMLENTL